MRSGAFSVTETGPAGFTATFSGDCTQAGQFTASGTIIGGQQKTCTITNTPQPTMGTLLVAKHVVCSGPFCPQAFQFPIMVRSDNLASPPLVLSGSESGTLVTLDPGTYTVTEPPRPDFITTFSGDCTQAGQFTASVTISGAQQKTCTITNRQ